MRISHVLAYAACIAAIAIVAYKRPLASFDRVLYAGAVVSLDTSDPQRIRGEALSALQAEPRFDATLLRQDIAEYVAGTLQQPTAIPDQVSLFRVKFGYVAVGWALWKLGLPLVRGLHLVSVLSFLGLSLVVLLWTRSPLASGLMMLAPPVLNTARTITADPLATVLAVLGLYLLQRGRIPAGVAALLASVFVRPDMAILAFAVAAALVILGSPKYAAVLGISAAALFTAISHWSGFYGWQTLFYHAFVHPLIHPSPQSITPMQYVRGEAMGLELLVYSFFPVYGLLAAVAWWLRRGLWVPVMLGAVFVRTAVFPWAEDRYFVWFYVASACMAVAAAKAVSAEAEDRGDNVISSILWRRIERGGSRRLRSKSGTEKAV